MKIVVQTLQRDVTPTDNFVRIEKGSRVIVNLPGAVVSCEAIENDEYRILIEAAEIVAEHREWAKQLAAGSTRRWSIPGIRRA